MSERSSLIEVRPAAERQTGAAAPRPRRTPRSFTRADAGMAAGSAISALLASWLVYYRISTAAGWLGFIIVWYAVFLAMYYVVCREAQGRVAAADRIVTVLVGTGALLMFAPLLWLLAFVVAEGLPALRPGFFVRDQTGVLATDPATAGGGLHAIVGTLEQVAIAVAISVPLGFLTAIFLSESRSRTRLRRVVRAVVDAMSGLPSVVAGLFIYAALVIPISEATGRSGFSGLMAGLALSIVMLPTVTRTVEVVLRLVPDGLREASYALGASLPRTVWSVVLPTARSGLATAVVLGIARAVGETAPLIFTSFGYNLINADPFDGAQDSLPLFVYARVQLQSAAVRERGFTGALVLVGIVLALFVITRILGRRRHRA
jgi:phosphate transport system permease protein